MYEYKEPEPLQIDFIFTGIAQIDNYAYGKVAVTIAAADKAIRNFGAVFEIPLRDVHGQSVQAIEDQCLQIARRSFDAEAILPLLGSPG